MVYSLIYEISKIEKFLFLIFVLLAILTTVRIIYLNSFSHRFYLFCPYIILLVFLNLGICFTTNLVSSIIGLIILSFISLILIVMGYGVSFEISFLIFFKCMGDFFLILYLGSYWSILGGWEMTSLVNFYNFYFPGVLFLIGASLLYSLCGIFGFWIYWAMEGSYFLSSYLHSVGFILISVVIIVKVYYLGLLEEYIFFIQILESIFFFSFIFFLFCFLVVKKVKKGFGYFSCSGVCFVFTLCINSPTLGVGYFFLSSIFKIIFFEIMGFLYSLSFKTESKIYKLYSSFILIPILYLSSVLLLYSEYFYFYICSDLFIDFLTSNVLSRVLSLFITLKFFGIFNLTIRVTYLFLKSYFNNTRSYLIDFSSITITLGIILISYVILFFVFDLEFHFNQCMIWGLLYSFFFSSFYKNFKISSLEMFVKRILENFYYNIFTEEVVTLKFLVKTFEDKKSSYNKISIRNFFPLLILFFLI